MKAERPVRVLTVLNHAAIYLTALIFMTPLIWMLATSLKPASEVFTTPPKLIGSAVQFHNYLDAWNYLPFARFMLNGLIVATFGTIIVLVVSVLAGYCFARFDFPGREKTFVIFLATLMVPQEVVVIPMYLVMVKLGLVNTYAALILPWAFTAFGTFLMRQFFRTLPPELEDSAQLDGAGYLRTLWSIVLPLAKPALGVLAVFQFIAYWNSFLWPLIITRGTDKATVPIGLNLFLGQNGNQWHLLMAASTISMIPTVALVLFLQRYLVTGIAMTGLGGR